MGMIIGVGFVAVKEEPDDAVETSDLKSETMTGGLSQDGVGP